MYLPYLRSFFLYWEVHYLETLKHYSKRMYYFYPCMMFIEAKTSYFLSFNIVVIIHSDTMYF